MDGRVLDDAVLFPTQVLGGLARIVLLREMPWVSVHHVLARGCENVSISVTDGGAHLELGVRFRMSRKGIAFVTSMHRRVAIPGDPFGMKRDEARLFYTDDPATRVVAIPSRHAFRSFWEGGITPMSRHNGEATVQRARIACAIERLRLEENFLAVMPDGSRIAILPLAKKPQVTSLPTAA